MGQISNTKDKSWHINTDSGSKYDTWNELVDVGFWYKGSYW